MRQTAKQRFVTKNNTETSDSSVTLITIFLPRDSSVVNYCSHCEINQYNLKEVKHCAVKFHTVR